MDTKRAKTIATCIQQQSFILYRAVVYRKATIGPFNHKFQRLMHDILKNIYGININNNQVQKIT